MSLTWQILTPALFSLAGVVVGSLLNPYATLVLERIRRRNEVRGDYIKALYKLFNLRKVMGTELVHSDNAIIALAATQGYLTDPNIKQTKEAIEQLTEQLKTYTTRKYKSEDLYNSAFNESIELEGELLLMTEHCRSLYGESAYLRVHAITKEIMKLSNQRPSLIDKKESYSYKEWSTLNGTLHDIVNNFCNDSDDLAEGKINSFNGALDSQTKWYRKLF